MDMISQTEAGPVCAEVTAGQGRHEWGGKRTPHSSWPPLDSNWNSKLEYSIAPAYMRIGEVGGDASLR